jgi:hypothetical protein
MRHRLFRTVCIGLAFTGAAFASTDARRPAAPPCLALTPAITLAPLRDGGGCLAQALCALKQKVGGRKAWAPALCAALAQGIQASAARHDLSPALLMAVMIQESDLDENAARVSHPHGGLARDSGLMGIRCVLDKRGRCTNGLVRGLAWREVMAPLTNIELGARYLAHYRDGAGRSRLTVRVRQPDGTVRTSERNVPCRHLDHAYWAHYNHGTRYIARGQARFYPRHVAALYAALGETLGLATPDLTGVKPAWARAIDHAPARRSVQLCAAIHSARPTCAAPAFASLSPAIR